MDYRRLPRARRTEGTVDFVALWEASEEANQADQIRERTIKELMGDTIGKIMELHPVTESVTNEGNEKDRITAILWNAFIEAQNTKNLTAKDVRLMRKLEEIAGEMVEATP